MDSTKYRLKKHVYIGDKPYEIRCDFSVILEIIEALNDPDLDDRDKMYVCLDLFYPDFENIPQEHYEEAISECFKYINCGSDNSQKKGPKLIDWEQDFPLIISPVNRVLGYEARGVPYDIETNTGGVPWETFIAAFNEIGDCLFAQVVGIRNKKAKGNMDKQDREFYRKNRELVDIKQKYTAEDNAFFDKLLGR